MTTPDAHPTTHAVYRALGPTMTDGDTDGVLLRYLDASARLLGDVDDRVRDNDSGLGWARELDPDLTLSPAWLGQFVGVTVPDGLSLADARARVLERASFRRGTPAALVAAAQAQLTGSRRVDLFERDGSAYQLRVRTYEAETPANLVSNPSFDVNTTGWNAGTRDTTVAHSGAASLRIDKLETSNATRQFTITLPASTTYTLSAYWLLDASTYGPSPLGVLPYLDVTGPNGYDSPNTSSADTTRVGVWQRVAHTFTTGAAGTYNLRAIQQGVGARVAWLDDVMLQRGTVATPYISNTDNPVRDALEAAKPAGLVLVHEVYPGAPYDERDAVYATYNQLDASATTYDTLDRGGL